MFEDFFLGGGWNGAFYEIMLKNIIEPDRPRMTIWRTCLAHLKAAATHSEYVILIAFPLQQCLHERASMFRYTNIDCLING